MTDADEGPDGRSPADRRQGGGPADDRPRDDGPRAESPPAESPPDDDEALLAECRVETFRAGGPGGQHQNRTESGVRLTHLPTGLSMIARESRSQYRNRKTALARLRAALEEAAREPAPRIPTTIPARERRKRREQKRRRAEIKRRRRRPEPEEE